TVTDANNSQSKQIEDIKSLIAQKPDALFIAPITEQLANVVKQAGQAGIPVFLLDRDVDHKVAVPGKDYVTVIQSDFIREGDRAAVAMAHATSGNAKILELEGTTGASPPATSTRPSSATRASGRRRSRRCSPTPRASR